MIVLRSCGLWILAMAMALAFATVPLRAEEPNAPPPPHLIVEGTTFMIRLEDTLDAARLRPGKHFKARLLEDLTSPDENMIVHGSRIRGHVSAVSTGMHPRLLLSFDEIETRRGWEPLMATIAGIPGEHGLTTGSEGEIERESPGSGEHRDPNSDGVSARAEATANVMRAIFSDHRLQLQKGVVLEVKLDRPLQVPR